ncbi:hypothetical protein CEP53_014384 [Fusarium sp. AF-6]|nr:hypothetical protein CEP53_014384 [Fusarium sp. AF-6]
MASSPANSQATNDDPAGPLSSAHHDTVTITPYNAEARLACSDVDWVLETSQADESGVEERAQASRHISISSRQFQDEEVGRLLAQIQTGHLSSSSPSSSGQHDPTPVANLAKYTHTGCYFVDLSCSPTYKFRGWTAGRRNNKSRNDLILCLENSALHGIRQHHAAFQVHKIGRILVRKISDRGVVEVNGEALGSREFRLFNKHSSFIRLGQLKYQVTYTRHSATEEYNEAMSQYICTSDGIQRPVDLSMTPTPAPGNDIQVGRWTLTSAGTVGIGGSGRVSVGVGNTGEVVALKRMSVASTTAPNNTTTLLKRR